MCNSNYHVSSLEFYRQLIRTEIVDAADLETAGSTASLFPDVHIASSCMQKALRRSDRVYAHGAAEMLRQCDEHRLWRRLVVCAFEDFGLVDLSLTARVTAVASSKNFRLTRGEARVLHHLIDKLLDAPKDRRLDDLYALGAAAMGGPGQPHRLDTRPLGSVVAPLVHRCVQLMAACERSVPHRSFRALSLTACEQALNAMARHGLVDHGLFELCEKGAHLSKCLLPLLVPLAIEATEMAGGLGEASDQHLAGVPLIDGIPAYAIDGFTRRGRTILERLYRQEPRLVQMLRAFAPKDRLDICHHMLFFAEGGRCNALVSDPLADALNVEAVVCGTRQSPEAAPEAVALMRELLPLLHSMRAGLTPADQARPTNKEVFP